MAVGPLRLEDYEDLARRRLPRPLFGYVAGAFEDNWSLRENRRTLERVTLTPRILRDTAGRTTGAGLLGQDWAAPFGIAPMGLAAMMTYDGDGVLARAADAENVPMILSGAAAGGDRPGGAAQLVPGLPTRR